MIYCVFDLETGVIRARFDTHPNDAEAQLQEGEGLYFGDADPVRHRIVGIGDFLSAVDKEKEDPGDGSVWVDHEGWISPEEQAERSDRDLKIQVSRAELADIRAMREFLIALPGSPEQESARARLVASESYKQELRGKLSTNRINAGKGTSEPSEKPQPHHGR